METETRKKYLDYNIRGINNFVQLPPDAFALALVKHGVPGLVPQTIILFPTSNCRLHLMTLLIGLCSDKHPTSVTQDLAKQVPEVQRCKPKQWVHFTTATKKILQHHHPSHSFKSSTNLEFHQLFEQDHESHQQQALADVSSSLVQKHPEKSLCPTGASSFAANEKKNHSHQLSGS